MVSFLANQGANLKARNKQGLKPEAVARQSGHRYIADLIAVEKITPLLTRLNVFKGLNEITQLKLELQQIKEQVSRQAFSP